MGLISREAEQPGTRPHCGAATAIFHGEAPRIGPAVAHLSGAPVTSIFRGGRGNHSGCPLLAYIDDRPGRGTAEEPSRQKKLQPPFIFFSSSTRRRP
ncbi:hypothetical protein NDU88_007614 [Pleurodeles waltl]|uniref:Uncharacterized protein n=1 Tax=Pleurodeles waltl TaxID=8319 RepID=A0AAV7RTD7_PLEWA|nr:hypothetical protein NDU88_007614 [Pleurodeles waltl]